MALRREGHGGGIAGLVELIEQHGEAVEYDLIALGLRLEWLGTKRLSWRDLWVILRQAHRGSALYRAEIGADHSWGLAEQLLAALVDEARTLMWSKTKDAKKGRNRPRPLPRPGVKTDEKYGKGAITTDAMDDWLGWSEISNLVERTP